MTKLNIYDDKELGVIKALPWCGGATIVHKNDWQQIVYYTVFVKPQNIIERVVTNYVLKRMKCTFVQEDAA